MRRSLIVPACAALLLIIAMVVNRTKEHVGQLDSHPHVPLAPTSRTAAPPPEITVLPLPVARILQPVATPTSHPDIGNLRQRPVTLPTLALGQACPRASGREVTNRYAAAVGSGPLYAAGLGTNGILGFLQPIPRASEWYGSAWSGQKVLWIIDPAYRGPVLIRGGQLDGTAGLRFNDGQEPATELWIEASGEGEPALWRDYPSYTRVRGSGCYAYQADGQGFSETIIFEARQEE